MVVRIGVPEKHDGDFRCPFQVVGLSDDTTQYSGGVDSLQALNLAFVGVWRRIEDNVKVLSGFYKKVSVENEYGSWDVTLPYWICVSDRQQLARLNRFLEQEFWVMPTRGDNRGDVKRHNHTLHPTAPMSHSAGPKGRAVGAAGERGG